ncbi:hypothetical protein FJZ19_05535 [Candidatus Pacearchaeota archaeon]|nr:hypothetical protein [Candidatus Pacearchaeota archaeon]
MTIPTTREVNKPIKEIVRTLLDFPCTYRLTSNIASGLGDAVTVSADNPQSLELNQYRVWYILDRKRDSTNTKSIARLMKMPEIPDTTFITWDDNTWNLSPNCREVFHQLEKLLKN